MATIKRIGFGQVEPNHLSAQRNGQVYAQLPCNKDIKVLENGQFVKYDYATNGGEVNFTGKGDWMLVMNEVKLYDAAWRESYKDFALQSVNYDNGVMVPRVFATHVGDIYTTNCLEGANTSGKATFTGTEEIEVGAELKINDNGFLSLNGSSTEVFQVVKVYTMPDGQQGVKVMRIK
jgi:hypothetical protein